MTKHVGRLRNESTIELMLYRSEDGETVTIMPPCERVRASAINHLVSYFHNKSKSAGWWEEDGRDLTTDKYVHATKLMLIVTEVSEAMEGLRKGLKDDKLPHRAMAEVELADALIRIFDLAGALGYDLGSATVEKDAFNTVRPDHQPVNRKMAGGKAY